MTFTNLTDAWLILLGLILFVAGFNLGYLCHKSRYASRIDKTVKQLEDLLK